ncbi:MAG: hypothetical protein OHK0029_41350 [Armatimonadaceae bacterium]
MGQQPQRLIEWGRRIGVVPVLLLAACIVPAPEPGAARIAGVPSLCLFHLLTGLPCPGCGMTRSVVSCAHGNWQTAWSFHPFGPVVFAGLVVASVQKITRFPVPPGLRRAIGTGAWCGVAILLGIWILRLAGRLPIPS